jgi:hypothetical protein
MMVTKHGHVTGITSRSPGTAKVSVHVEEPDSFMGLLLTVEEAAKFSVGQRVLVHIEQEVGSDG